MNRKITVNTDLRRKFNIIQQEVMVGTWDNFLLALTLFTIGLGITLIITGFSNLSPLWLLVILISFMVLWFIFNIFSLLLDSVFSKKNRFTNKSKFVSFMLAFFIFLILLVALPFLLEFIIGSENYGNYFKAGSVGFIILAIFIYVVPFISGIKIYPKIKRFFKDNCPTLILKEILFVDEENKKRLLKHWSTTLSELRKLDREY